MRDANLEYQLVLQELERRKQKEKDPKKIELLEKNIDEITKYLNRISREKSEQEINEFKRKLESEVEIIKKFLNTSNFINCNFSCFKIWNKNKKKLNEATFAFIKNTKFQLSNIFEHAVITQLRQKRKYCGVSIYIEVLDETYVFISNNDILTKSVTLIHELGHAKLYNIKKVRKMGEYFNEVYPKFLELIFSDYLIENGLEKQGYNVKISLLTEIKDSISNLNDSEFISNYDKFYALLNYKAIKENILVLSVYMMYKKNPSDILNKMDMFIDGLGKKNEQELLNIFGLDNSIFTNLNIANKFGKFLQSESKEIKQK